jgi:hypothetical protein
MTRTLRQQPCMGGPFVGILNAEIPPQTPAEVVGITTMIGGDQD